MVLRWKVVKRYIWNIFGLSGTIATMEAKLAIEPETLQLGEDVQGLELFEVQDLCVGKPEFLVKRTYFLRFVLVIKGRSILYQRLSYRNVSSYAT